MNIRSIHLAEHDADRVIAALEGARRFYMEADAHLRALEREIAGARRVPAHQIPADFVALYSLVRLRISNPPQEMRIQLVLPCEADPSRGRISILAPVGAILGYRLGEELDLDVAGKRRRIRILSIVHDPRLASRTAGDESTLPNATLHMEGLCHDQLSYLQRGHADLDLPGVRCVPWRQADTGLPADERPRSYTRPPGHRAGVATER